MSVNNVDLDYKVQCLQYADGSLGDCIYYLKEAGYDNFIDTITRYRLLIRDYISMLEDSYEES